jgi:surface polysaccharide O-acyltransferase-like enzyme
MQNRGSAVPAEGPTGRLQYLDVIKIVAMYLIVFYHAHPIPLYQPRDADFYPGYFLHGLSTIGVPLFILCNGFLLLGRPITIWGNAKKCLRLYGLTLAWSCITLLLTAAISGERSGSGEFLHDVFFLKSGVNNHLWFLFALLATYLFLPLIKLAFDMKNRATLYWLLFLLLFFSFGATALNWGLDAIKAVLRHCVPIGDDGDLQTVNYFAIEGVDPFADFCWVTAYFILGGLCREWLVRPRRGIPAWPPLLVIACAYFSLFGFGLLISPYLEGKVFDTVFNSYASIPTLLISLSAFFLFSRWRPVAGPAHAVISSIGANTLGIYVLHVPLLLLIRPHIQPWQSPACAAMVMLLSWGVSVALRRVPGLSPLFHL